MEVLGLVQRDQQFKLQELPLLILAVLGRFPRDVLIDIFRQPPDQRRRRSLAGGKVHQRHEAAVPQQGVKLRSHDGRVVRRFVDLRQPGVEDFPAVLGRLVTIAVQQYIEIHPLGGDPRGQLTAVLRFLGGQPGGEFLAGLAQLLGLLLEKLRAGELLGVRDGLGLHVLAGLQHAVGQLVEGADLLEKPAGGRLIAAQLPQQLERLVLVFFRPGLLEHGLEQLRDVRRPILFRHFADKPPQEGHVLVRLGGEGKDVGDGLGKGILQRGPLALRERVRVRGCLAVCPRTSCLALTPCPSPGGRGEPIASYRFINRRA